MNSHASKAAPRRGDMLYSLAAEQALLGCVLIDADDVWAELAEFPVAAEDFFMPEHQAIWRAMRYCADAGLEVKPPTVVYALRQLGVIDAVDTWLGVPALPGVEPYLTTLFYQTFSAKGSNTFMRMVQHYAAMRAPASGVGRREMSL